jgi:hypothetical protein
VISRFEQQDDRLAEREQALSEARVALRAEREQIAADRAEADRMLAESRAAHHEAIRERDHARRLAARLIRRVKYRHDRIHRDIDEREEKLTAEREKLGTALNQLLALRSHFHITAAETRDRIREAWAAVETQQRRANDEWDEAERYFAEQTARLDARSDDLSRREKLLTDKLARNEGETVGLREEAAALETRADNARKALAELERLRERARSELLGVEPTLNWTALSPSESGDLTDREAALAREKAAVSALREWLERETAELDDRKRVLAEQFALLASARAKWQATERQTMIEMEQMALELGRREADVNAREERVIRSDRRRRDDAYDLWQLRMRLEAWQTQLSAFELRWHTERAQQEADLAGRTAELLRRETEIEELFARWENARENERGRLRAELEHWAIDRQRLVKAAHDFEFQRQLLDAELSTCAARAMAAEQLVADAVHDSGSDRVKRRLDALQKRWERLFDRKVKAIELRRADAATELAALDERYRELHRLIADVAEREAAANNRAAAVELRSALTEPSREVLHTIHPDTAAAEMTALRNEVERLASLVINLEPPEPLALPESELPWGAEEPPEPINVFQFDTNARAA